MATDPTVRINDVLNFLANTPLVTIAERNEVHAFAQAFINHRYPVAAAATPGYRAFSQLMSLGYHFAADPGSIRNMRRAIILLERAMQTATHNRYTPRFQGANAVPAGTAPVLLTHLIRKARIVAAPGLMALNFTFNQVFLPDPLQFLQNNKAFVYGSTQRAVGQGEQNVLPFFFSYNPAHDRYELAPVNLNAGYPISAESVVAVHWSQVPGRGANPAAGSFAAIRGVELSGNHVMVTTQFTGCIFCMKEVGGVMYCAHIAPFVPGMHPSLNPLAGAQQLAGITPGIIGGNFANAPGGAAFRIYGRDLGSPPNPGGYTFGGAPGGVGNYMTILGVPGGTSYRIYSQTTMNHAISDVQQVL